MSLNVLVLVGSLRAESTNARLARAVKDLAPEGAEVTIFDGLSQLPFFSEDIEAEEPAAVRRLRDAVVAADAVLFVTPEYNGSVPSALAAASEWLSRPFGNGVVVGKPVVVIGAAFGPAGGGNAHTILRRAMTIAGARVLADEFLAIPGVHHRFAEAAPQDDAEILAGVTAVFDAFAHELAGELEGASA